MAESLLGYQNNDSNNAAASLTQYGKDVRPPKTATGQPAKSANRVGVTDTVSSTSNLKAKSAMGQTAITAASTQH